MQVHNELSKSDYFQKLNINDNISDISIWRPMTMDIESPKTLNIIMGEIITVRTCCLHYIVQEWTPHLGPDHYANRKLVLKH